MLSDILGKATVMPVVEAEDGMLVKSDRVFVIPPDATLTLKSRRLQVSRPAPPRERRRPIDTFFSSLAEEGENAVCIVLSGTGSDGSLGLKQIKENGGLTLAQAEFDHTAMSGMPHSAAATGLVDHVLPVEEMPAKLLEYRKHLLSVADLKDGDGTRRDASEHLSTIVALLRVKVGHDFSKYKEKTLIRRIQRRMQVLQADTVPAYIAHLRDDPRQIELLFRELLIGVTQFFRDPDAFEALQTLAIAKVLEHKSDTDPVRVWIPACATGEEAYSIAILLKEAMEQRGVGSNVQIFATDIDDNAVAFARSGRYRKTVGLSPERLGRWFAADDDEFCPIREIREMCVFSVHSVVKDPPFSKLDLLSCRNLLIYMDADLQDRVLRTFHYALKPGGVLFLGPSEGITRQGELFTAVDKKYRVFKRRDADATLSEPLVATALRPPSRMAEAPTPRPTDDRLDRVARRALAKYSPVYVVIDKHHNILRFSGGEAGRYLEPSAGTASLNLFRNLRKTLRPIVRAALQTALTTNGPAVHEGVAIRIEGRTCSAEVIVEPISDGGIEAGLCVVAFRESASGFDTTERAAPNAAETARLRAVEHELRTTTAQLQAAVDELETANEEMKSAAEEYQSVNEELQSSNEELETSKEEMQSINEELQTLNAEMTSKNATLTHLNSDLKNLLDSTQIATMFLDNNLRIKNFTPGMTDIFPLREGDRGRPVTEIVSLLVYDDLGRDVAKVLRDLAVVEREVQLRDAGATFIMRIRPYRTVDNVIDGVVMTFVDISQRRNAEAALRDSEARYRALFEAMDEGFCILERVKTGPGEAIDFRYLTANPAFATQSGVSGVVGRTIREAFPGETQEWFDTYDAVLRTGHAVRFERPLMTQGRVLELYAFRLEGETDRLAVVFGDITDRKNAEEHMGLLLGELDHRVKNILAIVSSVITQTLKTSASPGAFAAAIEGRIAAIATAHGVLTQKGKGGAASLRDLVTTELAPYDREGNTISIIGADIALTPRTGLSFAMAVHELASNAAKYGALSRNGGGLAVSWTLGDASSPMLSLIWAETGGPPIAEAPSQRGFGTTLIERTLTHELDAVVNREFLPSGLRCTIVIPLTADIGRVWPSQSEEGQPG